MARSAFTEAELRFLARMRVGRLATCDANGQPHVIPIVFVAEGHHLYTPLDEKPTRARTSAGKRVAPGQLKRVRNILVNPQVAVVVDEYDEDWSRLAWVLIRGTAEIIGDGEAHATAARLLRDKYPQYAEVSLERRPMIIIFGPTNYHRTFTVDFPGRIYCLGAPIYQLCLLAKGAVSALFFDPAVNLWDLAFPSLLLERTGAVMVYASGRPVVLSELMGRSKIPEPLFAGGAEVVDLLRQRIKSKT